jgi:hypothetical protein
MTPPMECEKSKVLRPVDAVGKNDALHADRDGLDHRYGVFIAIDDKNEVTVW